MRLYGSRERRNFLSDKHYVLVPNDTREVPFQLQGWCRLALPCAGWRSHLFGGHVAAEYVGSVDGSNTTIDISCTAHHRLQHLPLHDEMKSRRR
jgi:hypothetical protein